MKCHSVQRNKMQVLRTVFLKGLKTQSVENRRLEEKCRMAEEDALIHFDAWSKEQKRAEDCERKSQENREENESHTRGDVTRLQRQVLTVEKQRLKKARLSANAQAITELALPEPTPGCVEVCGGSLTRHQATHSSKKTMRG